MAEETAPAGTTTTETGGETKAADTAATALTGTVEKTPEQQAAEAAKGKEGDDPAKKAADEQAAKAKAEADAKASEVHLADLKLPEGVVTDKALVGEFEAVINESKISKEVAQKLVDLQLKSVGMFAQQRSAEHEHQMVGWHEEVMNDKDIGGAKVDATMTQARKAFAMLGAVPGVDAKRLSADLEKSGLTTHPDLVRAMHWLGQHVGDDNKFLGANGSSTSNKDKTTAEVLYGDTSPK